jgi:hypothetical protein
MSARWSIVRLIGKSDAAARASCAQHDPRMANLLNIARLSEELPEAIERPVEADD